MLFAIWCHFVPSKRQVRLPLTREWPLAPPGDHKDEDPDVKGERTIQECYSDEVVMAVMISPQVDAVSWPSFMATFMASCESFGVIVKPISSHSDISLRKCENVLGSNPTRSKTQILLQSSFSCCIRPPNFNSSKAWRSWTAFKAGFSLFGELGDRQFWHEIRISEAEWISDLHHLISLYFNLHHFTIVRGCEKGDVEERMLHFVSYCIYKYVQYDMIQYDTRQEKTWREKTRQDKTIYSNIV